MGATLLLVSDDGTVALQRVYERSISDPSNPVVKCLQ